MTAEQAVAEILQSSRAPEIVRDLQAVMERERQAREAFYEKVEPHNKWEFINGEIVMHSPSRDEHMHVSQMLGYIIQTWIDRAGEGRLRSEKALIPFSRNDYEPDICFFGSKKAAAIDRKDWKFPIPDLIVEILSPSTEQIDRGVKFRDYESHGVEEYWIIDPDREVIEQYLLNSEKYELEFKGADGTIHSRVLKGLKLPVRAAFDDEARKKVIREIQLLED